MFEKCEAQSPVSQGNLLSDKELNNRINVAEDISDTKSIFSFKDIKQSKRFSFTGINLFSSSIDETDEKQNSTEPGDFIFILGKGDKKKAWWSKGKKSNRTSKKSQNQKNEKREPPKEEEKEEKTPEKNAGDEKDKDKKDDDKEEENKDSDDKKAEESEISADEEEEEEDQEEEKDPLEEELNEPEGYDILKDPVFKDLETTSLFPEQEKTDNLLEVEKEEFYDVLDTSIEVDNLKPRIERKFFERNVVPPFPKGGWTWRPAKFVEEIQKEATEEDPAETIIWKLEYTDKNGGEVEINMTVDNHLLAPYETKTTLKKHHEFSANDNIDVEDRFLSPQTKKRVSKWRQAKVIVENGYWLRIQFLGWTHFWDEWLHAYMDQPRIAPFEKMTCRFKRRHDRQMSNFRKVLERKRGLRVVLMDADGNCLFRTVAHQIYGDPRKHTKVRKECCNHMLKNEKRFSGIMANFHTYIRKMKASGEWGDDLEIKAMEELYDRPFEIYQISGFGITYRPMQTHFSGDMPKNMKDVTPVRLSYHGSCHYNSIVPASYNMKKDNSFKAPPLLNTNRIQTHREKLMRKGEKEAKRAIREARRKEAEEKAKKAAEEEAKEEEEEANKEEKVEENFEKENEETDENNEREVIIKQGRQSDMENSSNEKSSESTPPPNEVRKTEVASEVKVEATKEL